MSSPSDFCIGCMNDEYPEGLLTEIETLRQQVKELESELQSAYASVDANWVTHQEFTALRRWKEAVLDQCMIAHSSFHEGDPRKTLDVLIDWHVKVALDPQVSAGAQALVDAKAKPHNAIAQGREPQAKRPAGAEG